MNISVLSRKLLTIILLLSFLAPSSAQTADSDPGYSVWLARFLIADGWGKREIYWVSSEGQAGFADFSLTPRLPCQFNYPEEIQEAIGNQVISALNARVEIEKSNPEFSCNDEPRADIEILYTVSGDDDVRRVRTKMSMLSTCNAHPIDQALFNAATIVLEYADALPKQCKIEPVKISSANPDNA